MTGNIRTSLRLLKRTRGLVIMVIQDLVKLADSLDRKGKRDLANAVDDIIHQYAHDMEDDASEEEESHEEDHEEAPKDDEVHEEAAPDSSDAEEVSEPPMDDAAGSAGKSWYGEKGPHWDLSPVPEGSMLDGRDALPTDAGGAAPVAVEVEVEEESPDEDMDEEDEGSELSHEAAVKLAELAQSLDKKGYTKEADLIDSILKHY